MLAGLVLWSCANIGSPEGGPVDYTPPVFVKSSPAQGAVNVKGNKVEITFDEIVNIKDQTKKVAVSPVQKNQPSIKADGRKVTIEFRDEMLPNTTYTIDFSNSIEDNNESNQMDNFAFTFSTGEEIDTMQISGLLLRARDLEPMQYMMVGLHSVLDDTAFTKIPFERMCRTNDRGQFTLRGVKPGRYHVFGLNDMDGDYRMARTEDIAFLDEIIVPTASRYESQDTVFTFDNKVDTIVTAWHTAYKPDNVLLTMFNENYRSLYLKTTSRPGPERLHVLLSAPSPELPQVKLLKPERQDNDWYTLQYRDTRDSIFYWINDSALIKSDSLTVELSYLRTDSTDNLSLKTDTVTFAYRKTGTQLKEEKEKAKEREQLEKRMAQLREKKEKGKELDPEEERELSKGIEPEVPKLDVSMQPNGDFNVYDTLFISFPTPIKNIDPAGVHLEMKHDTLWQALNVPALQVMPGGDALRYMLPYTFEPDSSYRLLIDSLAVTSIYDIHNDPFKKEFKVKALEDYANLTVHVNVVGHAFIELLNGKDVVQRTMLVKNSTATFENVLPGTYYLRLVLDENDNGEWDTGNYQQHRQPEEVYYYPKRLKLRKNWDMDETWDIYATALDLQKHTDILKNKPVDNKSKFKTNTDKNKKSTDDEDEDDDEFNSNAYGSGVYSGNKYKDYQNTRR